MSRPPNNIEFVKDLVQKRYNIRWITIKELNGYDDRNYYIKTDDSKEYILKITNKIESEQPGLLDAFNEFILRLYNNGFKVTVPLINTNGKYVSFEKIPQIGEDLQHLSSNTAFGFRVLEYIPGKLLLNVKFTPKLLTECGQVLAKMTKALENFDNKVLRKRNFLWSLLNVLTIRQYLDAVDSHLNRDIVSQTLEEYKQEVLPILDDLDSGIINGDFNEQNIIVDNNEDSKEYHFKGVIDFGDIHFAPKVFDLAIYLAYSMLEFKAGPQVLAPGFGLKGYMQFRKLTEIELNVLIICIKARLCQSLVLGAHSHRLDPTNVYVLSSAKNGWPALRALHECNRKDILNKWLNIDNHFNQINN